MITTLQKWNSLINETLHPSNHSDLIISDELIENVLKQSKEEHNIVRNLIVQDILERKKIKDKKQYISLIQLMLVDLIDKLYYNQQSFKLPEKIYLLHQNIEQHLLNTLNFIQEYFPDYFNFNQKVPKIFLSNWLPDFHKQVEDFKKSDQFSCVPDRELKDIVIKNMSGFGCVVPTYKQLRYQQDLLSHLIKHNDLSTEESLKKILFFFNYNDTDCVRFFCTNFSCCIQKLPDKTQKISALLLEQKKINQLPHQQHFSLLERMPSLQEQLNCWIEAEIMFIQKNESIPNIEKDKTFIHVPFRGTEIYLLHKAFIDSGGASGETYKSFLQKTASHLINNKRSGFSIDSLQKNSDKINYEAKDNVKRFLQKMIRNIDSY
jgi:hypothetical protein